MSIKKLALALAFLGLVFHFQITSSASASPNDDADFEQRMSKCEPVENQGWTSRASAFGLIIEGPGSVVWDVRQTLQSEATNKTQLNGLRLVVRFTSPNDESQVHSLNLMLKAPESTLSLPGGRSGALFTPNTPHIYSTLLFTKQNETLCEQVGMNWVGRMFPELTDMPACRATNPAAATRALQRLQSGEPIAMKVFLPISEQWVPWYQGVIDAQTLQEPLRAALTLREQDLRDYNSDDPDKSTCYRRF